MTDTAARAASLTLGDIAALIDKVEALETTTATLKRLMEAMMNSREETCECLTVEQAAAALGVDKRVVLRWARNGELGAWMTDDKQTRGWRIQYSALMRFIKRRQHMAQAK